MKKASLHSIFWIIFTIAFTFLLAYIYTTLNTKTANLLTRDLGEKSEKYKIPVFEIKDVEYSEAGSVATLTFNLINMGDPIITRGWIVQFLTPDGSTICRMTIFTGDPTEAGRVYTEIKIPSRNVTITEADKSILSGEVAEVSMTLISTCLNETIKYARTGEKMVVRLTIPPTSSEARLACIVDPNTGFATCTG